MQLVLLENAESARLMPAVRAKMLEWLGSGPQDGFTFNLADVWAGL